MKNTPHIANKYETDVRIFKSDFMEALTHVHPIIPLVMWAPFAAYLYYLGLYVETNPISSSVLAVVLGVSVWTLMEYCIHRFCFHFDAQNKATKYLVFLFHGLHHDDPQCPTRLVMPPAPAIIFMTLFFLGFRTVVPESMFYVFMATFVVSYLVYDYIHYATHHFKMRSGYWRFIKKYHLQHHNTHEYSRFGVSNPFWDYIFRTYQEPKGR